MLCGRAVDVAQRRASSIAQQRAEGQAQHQIEALAEKVTCLRHPFPFAACVVWLLLAVHVLGQLCCWGRMHLLSANLYVSCDVRWYAVCEALL